MEKVLIIANTYFQVITAINLKLTILKESFVDIVITDISTNYDLIAARLEKTKLFNSVQTANIDEICYKKNKLIKYKSLFFWKNTLKKFIKKDNYNYDVLMFFNYDVFTYSVFNKIYECNKDIKVYRYEEGFCSYLYDFSHLIITKVYRIFRKIARKPRLEEKIEKYYFYHPDIVLFKANYKFEKIPTLDRANTKLLEILNNVFDYKKVKEQDEYNKKYIFFEECFFCDNIGVDDFDLIMQIADIVGRENLLVKLHPRNKIDRFSKYGISTNKTIGIPWEVIQMNREFSDKIFLTISSGSVLASKLYFGDNIKTYLLFNCTEKMSNMVGQEYFEYLRRIQEKFGINDFCIPNNKTEFLNTLKKEVKE